jgi:hypothetical protein
MPRLTEQAREIAYPQLSKDQIDAAIASLVMTLRDRELGASQQMYEQTLSYLIGFRTRRWGLPPALAGRGVDVTVLPPRQR